MLDLVDALLGLLHGDRDLGAVDADLARDRRGHVRLALGAALRLGDGRSRDHLRAVLDREHVARRDRDRHGVILRVANDDLSRAIRIADELGDAVDLADDRDTLGDACLEELLDARETHGDVLAGDAAGVEGTHRELRARLADGLSGDDPDGLAHLHELAAREAAAVAGAADAVLGVTSERRPHASAAHARVGDGAREHEVDRIASLRDHPVGLGFLDVLRDEATEETVGERLDRADLVGVDEDAVLVTAILEADDHVLRDVDETAREVPGVRGTDGRVGETLAATVRRDEVLEDREALPEVRTNRQVDDPALRVGDEATHATDLAHLLRVTTRAGRGHHVDGATPIERAHHGLDDIPGRVGPDLHRRLVTLLLGDEAALELAVDVGDLLLGRRDHGGLLRRDRDVVDRDGNAGHCGGREADGLDLVDDVRGDLAAVAVEERGDDLADLATVEDLVDEPELLRQHRVEEHPADGRLDDAAVVRDLHG